MILVPWEKASALIINPGLLSVFSLYILGVASQAAPTLELESDQKHIQKDVGFGKCRFGVPTVV